MIDIGINLLHPQFDPDRLEVLARARSVGVTDMLVTSTDLATSMAAIDFCEQNDLYCTAGVHPHDASDAPADLLDRLTKLASSPRVKAIGETGLDFNRNYSPPAEQRKVFEAQLGIAQACAMPVFVHDRDSDGAVFELLKSCADDLTGIVVHCFTGTAHDLARYLELGCYIGITGWICDKRRGAELRGLIGELPLDRLLIESDAPFLLPQTLPTGWHAEHAPGTSRRRNEPALLPLVARQIAELLGVTEREIVSKTTANARALFNLPAAG